MLSAESSQKDGNKDDNGLVSIELFQCLLFR